MRKKRYEVDASFRQSAAMSAVNLFLRESSFSSMKHIACYHSMSDEFDTAPLIHALLQANKKCYLPALNNKQLIFRRYEKNDALTQNAYGILEPLASAETIASSMLDLVIAPLVGFDLSGNRLGAGGGYYDKTFSFLKNVEKEKPFLLGLGYSFQEMSGFIAGDWDIKLDAILTEQRIIFCLPSALL